VSASTIVDLLKALSKALRECGLRWYLFGAQAVILYGRPRMTADVDVTVEVGSSGVPSLLRILKKYRFEMRVPGFDELVMQARVLPLVHRSSGIGLDLVIAGPGLEEEFLDRAGSMRIGGLVVPVITPEDLVATKILAARPQDVLDVRGILAERASSLDLARIRDVLGALEDALGQSDLMPLFEELLADSSGVKSPRRKAAKKRPRRNTKA
jgi:hypothetical protein